MQLWVASWVLSKSTRPTYTLPYEPFPRRLAGWKRPQQSQQPSFRSSIRLEFCLVVCVDKKHAQVASTATLSSFQEPRGPRGEYVYRGIPV